MIPKIIHYCWFGGAKKTRLVKKCIKSWKKHCPDYKIIEWNEDNFDVSCNTFCAEMYKRKKWAFLSDYARLKIIFENGGIYLDTDVELVKPLDPLLSNRAYMGYEINDRINTGLGFGSVCGLSILKENMILYDTLTDFDNLGTNVDFTTTVFRRHGIRPDNGTIQHVEDIALYPVEYFCPKPVETGLIELTDKTISIHHYTGSWFNKEQRSRNRKRRFKIKLNHYLHTPNRILKKFLGEDRYNKLKQKIKK